jgi:hypothetical protein
MDRKNDRKIELPAGHVGNEKIVERTTPTKLSKDTIDKINKVVKENLKLLDLEKKQTATNS